MVAHHSLPQWTFYAPHLKERLWPLTAANVVHFHVPVLVLVALAVELLVLFRRGQVRTRSVCVGCCFLRFSLLFQAVLGLVRSCLSVWYVLCLTHFFWRCPVRRYMCAGSSLCFYWLLYTWMFCQEAQSVDITPLSPGNASHLRYAAFTAQSSVAMLFSGAVRGASIHAQLLTSPALWLVVLLPPPAFLTLRVLKFPKLGKPVDVSLGQRVLSRLTSVLLWLGNASMIAITTLLTSHVLTTLSNRSSMLALLHWERPPEGATFMYPDHLSVYVGVL